MKKSVFFASLIVCCFVLVSCSSNGKIILPFEADLEKHFTALEKHPDGTPLSENDYISVSSDVIILENDLYSVGLNGQTDALWLSDRNTCVYYDMTGASFSDPSAASSSLYIYREGDVFCEYSKGVYYDTVYEKYRPSLTAFYLSENTVRLIYVIGIDQLAFLGEYPVIITKETYEKNALVCSEHYVRSEGNDFASKFVSEYCTLSEYYYLVSDNLPEPARVYCEFDAAAARREILSLGFDADKAVVCMFVADITLDDSGITVDISTNRQYRSKGVRTSRYKIDFFSGDIPFVRKTDSESEYISFAGSKF
ncbi:MAG: hypothetical protein II149_02040 [Clostridia bacterium]|nr:hypothetical protein [Clostridia bacterium]